MAERTPYCEAKGCASLPPRAHLELHARVGSTGPEHATALIDAYRAEVLREGAAALDSLADQTEAKITAHYGAGSGIGPGSCDMVREAARMLREIAASDTPTAGADLCEVCRTPAEKWTSCCAACACAGPEHRCADPDCPGPVVPPGDVAEPYACARCGLSRRQHAVAQRWKNGRWHDWEQPGLDVVKSRMRARRTTRARLREFEALLDASSLGDPHVRYATHIARAARKRARRGGRP